ncbi:hypothetical protein SLS60_010948 [Paraconiothyrium brasiliense]|uniref:Uncharacterized protein n=1 Tax=Paraconiothyrium brasiliense TaxID=300254 RepID=A0ABR3QMI6_9PLEO
METFKIEIGITPPSSPELSASDSDIISDDGIDEFSLDGSHHSSTPASSAGSQNPVASPNPAVQDLKSRSPLGRLLQAYTAANGGHHKGTEGLRQKILDYIHKNAVTVADVKLLIPKYENEYGFINKLVSAFGFHCAAKHVSEMDKEAVLLHILMHSDERANIYERVHARIAECAKMMNVKPRQLRAQCEKRRHEQREQQKQEQERAKRMLEFPAYMRQPVSTPNIFPLRATSWAQMYLEIYGMSWAEVRCLGKNTEASTAFEEPWVPKPDFATTGPLLPQVLYKRRKPKVNVPSKEALGGAYALMCLAPADWVTPNDWHYHDHLAKKATAMDGGLFGRDDDEKARVKLPSRKTVQAPSKSGLREQGEVAIVEMPVPSFNPRADRAGLNFLYEG